MSPVVVNGSGGLATFTMLSIGHLHYPCCCGFPPSEHYLWLDTNGKVFPDTTLAWRTCLTPGEEPFLSTATKKGRQGNSRPLEARQTSGKETDQRKTQHCQRYKGLLLHYPHLEKWTTLREIREKQEKYWTINFIWDTADNPRPVDCTQDSKNLPYVHLYQLLRTLLWLALPVAERRHQTNPTATPISLHNREAVRQLGQT